MAAVNRLAAGLLVLLAVIGAQRPARADSLAFTVLKGDDPIGRDVYDIVRDGDTTKVTVNTETRARVMFISFHYLHHRTEVWKDGMLVSFDSETDDDGTKHKVAAHRDGSGLIAMADGAHRTMRGDAIPMTLWRSDLMTGHPLFDIADFAPLRLTVEDKGADRLNVGGQRLDSHRFHISGDLVWDLWFGAGGGLLKVGFKRMGYPITLLRESTP